MMDYSLPFYKQQKYHKHIYVQTYIYIISSGKIYVSPSMCLCPDLEACKKWHYCMLYCICISNAYVL